MEITDHPDLLWGLSLIVLTVTIHATAVVLLAFAGVRIDARLEGRGLKIRNLIPILICLVGVIGLLLAVLHGIECGIWAAAYVWLGALDSPLDALLYSLDSMSTRGASGLTLQRPWRMLGALEAVDGMLLFGVSTAYLFAVMQVHWSMLTAHATPAQADARWQPTRTPGSTTEPSLELPPQPTHRSSIMTSLNSGMSEEIRDDLPAHSSDGSLSK